MGAAKPDGGSPLHDLGRVGLEIDRLELYVVRAGTLRAWQTSSNP